MGQSVAYRYFQWIFFFSVLSVLLLFPQKAYALCGSYFSYANPPCVDARSYDVVDPYVICSGLQSICCSTQTECAALLPTPPPGATSTPTPPPGDSDDDCGIIWAPAGQEQCLDVGGDQIYPYTRCNTQNELCCRSHDICPVYRCDVGERNTCIVDPGNGFYATLDDCQSNCTNPPDSGDDDSGPIVSVAAPPLCQSLSGTREDVNTPQGRCFYCFEHGGSWTAIGCIPTSPQGFLSKFLGFGVGMAGGIAFLLILLGGFQVLTSAGNPEHLNAGKELIGAAITGLLLIVFSLFILRLIGYTVLGIPGFG